MKFANEVEYVQKKLAFRHHVLTALEQVFVAVGLPLNAETVDDAVLVGATMRSRVSSGMNGPSSGAVKSSESEGEEAASLLVAGLPIEGRSMLPEEVEALLAAAD